MAGYAVTLSKVRYTPSPLSAQPVLNDVTIEIGAGEFVAVVGLNGAGKSSLLRAIVGEIQISEGEVRVGGQRVSKPINRVIDGVGVVHQFDSPDLIEHLTVAQNISIRQLLGGGHPNRVLAGGNRWRRHVASRLADEAKLEDYDLDEIVLNLNGGRRQVLSVAIAVHFEHEENPCRLLLLDEHTSRLDHRNSVKVMDYTGEQALQAGATVLMITHRYADALRFSDRILVMERGRVKRDLLRKDIGDVPELKEVVEV